MPDTFQTADQLRIKHDLDQVEAPVSILARALINKNNSVVLDLSECRSIEDVRSLVGGSGPYLLKETSFAAVVEKAYAVDTSAVTVVPAVMPSVVIGGLRFTGTAFDQATGILIWEDFAFGKVDDHGGNLGLYIELGVTTLQDIIDLMSLEGAGITLVELAPGASGTDLAVSGSGTLSGGSPETIEPTPVTATLPESPTEGQYIDFADARGTWGSNPLTVSRNGHKIEGVTADFINNASGTFFRLLYVDSAIGWRVLASGTKPLNLTAPTITGSPYVGATLTAGNGTWTGSPTSFSYQWQSSSDAGDTWSNIGGATSQTYTLTSGEDGKIVRVRVIATNANGPSVAVASLPTEEIIIPPFPMGGLLAFWKLADLTDASSGGNTLTNNNDVTFAAGKLGNAADFSGGGYLSLASNPLSGATAFSISAWFKTEGISYEVIVGNLGGTSPVYLTPGGYLVFDADSSGTARITSSAGWNDGQWHHCVAIYTGTVMKLFIDGVSEGTLTISASPDWASNFVINAAFHGSFGLGTGMIDAVGLWDRGLADLESATIYNGGVGLEPA